MGLWVSGHAGAQCASSCQPSVPVAIHHVAPVSHSEGQSGKLLAQGHTVREGQSLCDPSLRQPPSSNHIGRTVDVDIFPP